MHSERCTSGSVGGPGNPSDREAVRALRSDPTIYNQLKEETSMNQATIIGIDLAKQSFQLHGAAADGSVVFRKKFTRHKLLDILSSQPPCMIAMEACGSAHHWGREALKFGHEVKLIPPVYVKPFVKSQKNDETDAEAIVEAAQRPTMSFVAVKTEEQQARGMLSRTRDLLVRQRTQSINVLRGHLAMRPGKEPVWRSASETSPSQGAGSSPRSFPHQPSTTGTLASPHPRPRSFC